MMVQQDLLSYIMEMRLNNGEYMSTISLATTDPKYQGNVTFNVTLTGKDARYDCSGQSKCARVELQAFQDGNLVYGETGSLGQARGDGTDPLNYSGFTLGGGWSLWVESGGGPAYCVAKLFRYDHTGKTPQFVVIAQTEFEVTA
jgi:hypothetical protein